MTTQGFYDDFLEDNPNILYNAVRPVTTAPGRGRSFLDYWRGQQGNVYQDYLGGLGRTALSGQEPTQTFQSFLGDFDFEGFYRGLSPTQRRGGQRAAAPRPRYLL